MLITKLYDFHSSYMDVKDVNYIGLTIYVADFFLVLVPDLNNPIKSMYL